MYKVKFTTVYKKSYRLMKKCGLDLSLLDFIIFHDKSHKHRFIMKSTMQKCVLTS